MSNQLSVVDFDSLGIRWVEDDNGEKWFVAADIHRFRNPSAIFSGGSGSSFSGKYKGTIQFSVKELYLEEKFLIKYPSSKTTISRLNMTNLKGLLNILTTSADISHNKPSSSIKSSLIEHLAKSLDKNFVDLWEILRTMDVSDLPPDRYVYVARESVTGRYKIGISINPVERVKQLNVGNPEHLELIHYYQANEAGYLSERAAHEVYEEHRLHGEWFDKNIDLTLLPEMPL